MTVAVLFARADSVYKTIPDCDVWDIERDARLWPGGCAVVAHPPCRAWGNLRHFARPRPDEKALAIWAIEQVRKWGGVLEHPKRSTLWPHMNLPFGSRTDEHGGFTLPIRQYWFGHRAEKETLLYIVGVPRKSVPTIPIQLGEAPAVLGSSLFRRNSIRRSRRPDITKAEREHTPPPPIGTLACRIGAQRRSEGDGRRMTAPRIIRAYGGRILLKPVRGGIYFEIYRKASRYYGSITLNGVPIEARTTSISVMGFARTMRAAIRNGLTTLVRNKRFA